MSRALFLVMAAAAIATAVTYVSEESGSGSCVECKTDPCVTNSCLDPNATCGRNWCECTAHWYRSEDGSTPQCTACPDGTDPFPCWPPPCLHPIIGSIGCHSNPYTTCYNSYCDGCWAKYRDAGGNTVDCDVCADGSAPIDCWSDETQRPCNLSTCAEPGATCYNNYCGNCSAVWLRSDGTAAHCSPHPECPADMPYWDNCTEQTSPCATSKCSAEPNATCKNNFCGGCFSNWTRADGSPAQCHGSCPDGSNPETCAISPCSRSSCPGDLSATCKDEGCGGCHAVWTSKNGLNATCSCPPYAPASWCPAGLDLCPWSWCPFESNATCHMTQCGYCHPEWVKANGAKAYCYVFF